MLIEFSLGSYKSFHKIQTISFRATSLNSDKDHRHVDEDNLLYADSEPYLKALVVYGPNGSGKSNLIKGLSYFRELVRSSQEKEDLPKKGFAPFRLSTTNDEHFGYFQIVLLLDQKKYRYGFSLDKDAHIESEWLYGPAEKNGTYYFTRKRNEVIPNEKWFKEGFDLPMDKLGPDTLFLTFNSSYEGEISKQIRRFIVNKISVDPGVKRSIFFSGSFNYNMTNRLLELGNTKVVLAWLKEVGLPFTNVELIKVSNDVLNRSFVKLSKLIFDENGNPAGETLMDLEQDESEGTKKFYSYIGRLYQLFNNGGVYVSDEIDSSFHSSLLHKLITMFQNRNINKAGAQLLVTSHDTNLMDPRFMRRDQFYFTEKSVIEETQLYSLSDLKGIRNNVDFCRQYLAGFYGALPILSNYLEENTDS